MIILPMVVALLAGLQVVPDSDDWRVDLSSPASVSELSATRTTLSVYQPHTLRSPANAFTASVDGPATVDVRGLEPDGHWTEWTETPAVLATPTNVVQVRVVHDGAPPRGVIMHPTTVAADPPARTEAGLTYEVFATREGLVGGKTASGHIIVERDHFVALPSRRGLSTKDAGDYTAKVCAKNGRCEWAPVWDVGPWNTKDDYWNPPDVRQMWTELPQGRPQAQAAKLDGYNGGRDQFGRIVRNPAGLDLADGTFWDGLQLPTNAWVTITFLWTANGPTGTVTETINVHAAPHPDAPGVGLAARHAQVRIQCRHETGTGAWYRIAADMWITAAHVSGGGDIPTC